MKLEKRNEQFYKLHIAKLNSNVVVYSVKETLGAEPEKTVEFSNKQWEIKEINLPGSEKVEEDDNDF